MLLLLLLKDKLGMYTWLVRKAWYLPVVVLGLAIAAWPVLQSLLSHLVFPIQGARSVFVAYLLIRVCSLMPMVTVEAPVLFMILGSGLETRVMLLRFVSAIAFCTIVQGVLLSFAQPDWATELVFGAGLSLLAALATWIKFHWQGSAWIWLAVAFVMIGVAYVVGAFLPCATAGILLAVVAIKKARRRPELDRYLAVQQLSYEAQMAAAKFDLARLPELAVGLSSFQGRKPKPTHRTFGDSPTSAIVVKNLLTLWRTSKPELLVCAVALLVGTVLFRWNHLAGGAALAWLAVFSAGVFRKPHLQLLSKIRAGLDFPLTDTQLALRSALMPLGLAALSFVVLLPISGVGWGGTLLVASCVGLYTMLSFVATAARSPFVGLATDVLGYSAMFGALFFATLW